MLGCGAAQHFLIEPYTPLCSKGDMFQKSAVYKRQLYIIGLFNYAKKSFNHLKAWDIDAYLRHLTNKGLKPSSRNTAAATLRSFFRHLVDSGVCTVNPAAFLKRKRNDGKGSLPGHLSHKMCIRDRSHMGHACSRCDRGHCRHHAGRGRQHSDLRSL